MADYLGRPDWDDYFMAIAFVVSTRSLDPRTRHGCVIVDRKRRILSVGYNSPPRGCIDENIPMDLDEKMYYMVHAEANAVFNCNQDMDGGTAYVTGYPCNVCLQALIQKGIKKIVYGPIVSVHSEQNEPEKKACQEMLIGQNIEVVKRDDIEFLDIFVRVFRYMRLKGLDVEKYLASRGISVADDNKPSAWD